MKLTLAIFKGLILTAGLLLGRLWGGEPLNFKMLATCLIGGAVGGLAMELARVILQKRTGSK